MNITTHENISFTEIEQPIVLISDNEVSTPPPIISQGSKNQRSTPKTTPKGKGKEKTIVEPIQTDIVMDESDEFEEVELQEYNDGILTQRISFVKINFIICLSFIVNPDPDPEPEQDEINQFQNDRTIEITFSAPEIKKYTHCNHCILLGFFSSLFKIITRQVSRNQQNR